MKTIYFVTGNKGKLKEAKIKLNEINVNVIQKNLGCPEIQADSLEEVARFGVDHISPIFDKPFILEDAGLFINALKGFPGVYSAYVYRTIGLKGILRLMENKENDQRIAMFRSVYAYKEPDMPPMFFVGECEGIIAKKEQGTQGFGYDPIFIPKGEKRTFAEMETAEKNIFSHRGKSLEKLMRFLEER